MMNTDREIIPPKGLILSEREWNRINRYLNPELIKPKNIEADSAYEEYLKKESKKMTEKWNNTIERVRQRKVMEQKKKTEEERAEGMNENYLKMR